MRVLILSCNTGEGHNSCGKAIQESFGEKQICCDMEDALRFISPGISKFISFGFARVYRHLPGLFRFGYQYSERHPGVFDKSSGIYKFLTLGADRLHRFIVAGGYNAVICTHVFSALIVTDILQRHQPILHTYFVATDYTCSPSCEQSCLGVYFIPGTDLTEEFVRCGLPSEKLIASGLPVRKDFYHKLRKTSAKESLGLSPDCPHLLIMCGSMGCGPIRKIARLISKTLPKSCHVSVICGTNRRLQKSLERMFAKECRIHIYGYVKDISSMMDSADLYLTKPGGISVTEAAQKRLPMVFVNAVAGCESYNMRYFMEKGAAVTASTPEELAAISISLLKDKSALQRMSEQFPESPAIPPSDRISQFVLDSYAAGQWYERK